MQTITRPSPRHVEVDAAAPRGPAAPATKVGGRSPVTLGYLPSLDGLRAVAVMAVLIYHAGVGWLPGGFLGVEVFFVISGYLITSLLLAERLNTGGVSFGSFWARRARRLLPALYLMLVVVSAWWLLFLHNEVRQVRGDVVAALTYVTNWWLTFSRQSYFVEVGRPSPFRHLWSLAVEEQFYLLWPLIFVALMAMVGGNRRRAATWILGAVALSSVLMFVLFNPSGDPSRPYYGTDTRASGLLLGAVLALAVPPWRFTTRTGRWAGEIIDIAGLVVLGLLAWFFLRVNEFDPFIYRRGFLLLDLLTVAVIVAVIHPAGRLWRGMLSSRPMVWIGRRSYGIYLWHWPVFVLTRPRLDVALTGLPLLVLRLAITIGLADLSYRFVEQPVRHGALRRAVQRWRAVEGPKRAVFNRRTLVSTTTAVVLVFGVVVGLAFTPAARHAPRGLEGLPAGEPTIPPSTTPTTAAAPTPIAGQNITAIGDSVMLGTQRQLQARMPGIYVNAAVGRMWYEVPHLAGELARAGYLRPVVILHLGTNGAVSESVLDELLGALKGKRVVLVNTRVDRPWRDLVNHRLATAAATHPNTVLVDWAALSDGHPGYFVEDGVHLTKSGELVYADLLAHAAG